MTKITMLCARLLAYPFAVTPSDKGVSTCD